MTENRRKRGFHLSFEGLVLIFIGLALLLRNLGFLPPDIIGQMWRLWPLLVIAWGIQIMAGRRGMGLATVLIILLLLAAAGAFFLVPVHCDWSAPVLRREHAEPLQGVAQAEVVLDFAAGTLRLGALPAASPYLSHLAVRGDAPQVTFARRGPANAVSGQLEIRRRHAPRHVLIDTNPVARWDLNLSTNLPLALDITTAASSGRLDLRHLNVHELDLTVNAGHGELYLPERDGRTEVEIEANAANVNIVLPHDVAAQITVSAHVSVVRVDGEWERKGEVYTSPNFAAAERRIELHINANASRVHVAIEAKGTEPSASFALSRAGENHRGAQEALVGSYFVR
jgi:hypothetical protein